MNNTTIDSAADRMTPAEVSDLLGVEVQTLAAWRSSGRHELPFLKIGRKVAYSRRAVEAWLSQRTVTSCAQARAALATV